LNEGLKILFIPKKWANPLEKAVLPVPRSPDNNIIFGFPFAFDIFSANVEAKARVSFSEELR
jgi:hypothetical protein